MGSTGFVLLSFAFGDYRSVFRLFCQNELVVQAAFFADTESISAGVGKRLKPGPVDLPVSFALWRGVYFHPATAQRTARVAAGEQHFFGIPASRSANLGLRHYHALCKIRGF